jgi:uncharacterized OB-fold protein
MSDYLKFLPPDDLPDFHLPFWQALRNHEFRVQECAQCGARRFIPAEICSACGAQDATWQPVSGKGTLYTFTVVHRGPTPAYQADGPYVIAHVDLDDGVRVIANLTGCDLAEVRIGMRAEIVFDDVSDEWTLFGFVPEKA